MQSSGSFKPDGTVTGTTTATGTVSIAKADDGTQISGQSALSFVLDNSKYSVGYHSLMIEVTDTDNNVYTATWEVGITY